jgi:hypothetical protein
MDIQMVAFSVIVVVILLTAAIGTAMAKHSRNITEAGQGPVQGARAATTFRKLSVYYALSLSL